MNKARMLPRQGTYKYFQPVITNNTMVVSAKVQDDKDEILEKSKVYKYKVNLSESKDSNDKKVVTNKEDEINNKVIENIRQQIKKEIAESQLQENKDVEKNIKEEAIAKKDANADETEEKVVDEAKEEIEEKVADEAKEEIEEKVADEVKEEAEEKVVEEAKEEAEEKVAEEVKEEAEEKVEEVKEEIEEKVEEEKNDEEATKVASKNNIKDVTTKMDLPFLHKKQENSVPFRREAPDNIKEFKVKLFLLATNAKNPVRIMVNRKKFLIGSDFEQMDCVIRNNQYISRCHAKIHYESDCYYIEDAGSMNGTYINGVKLAEGLKYKLIAGDIINLADCRFEVSMK